MVPFWSHCTTSSDCPSASDGVANTERTRRFGLTQRAVEPRSSLRRKGRPRGRDDTADRRRRTSMSPALLSRRRAAMTLPLLRSTRLEANGRGGGGQRRATHVGGVLDSDPKAVASPEPAHEDKFDALPLCPSNDRRRTQARRER